MDGTGTWPILILGGTIKAATSSIFTYLSAHPQVCGSSVKETLFFTHEYSGDRVRDLERYRRYFARRPGASLAVEASPSYLAYGEDVAPRIRALLPEAKLLFILRDPVDRLYSHFKFAKGKLELPPQLTFEAYVELCRRYAPRRKGVIAEKHARALEIGEYSKYLKRYRDVFPEAQVKVVFYDDLHRDARRFMAQVCGFIGVDSAFYGTYEFERVNASFSARLKPLHRVALLCNRAMEPLLRQRPALKARIRAAYRRLNLVGNEGAGMARETRAGLAEHYAPSNAELRTLLAAQDLPPWLRDEDGVNAGQP